MDASILSTINLPQAALGIGSVAAAGAAAWAGSAMLKEKRTKRAADQALRNEANAIAAAEAAKITAEAAEQNRKAQEDEALRLAEEAERKRQESLDHIRQAPMDFKTKVIGEANTELAVIENNAATYEREANQAQGNADDALAEFPDGTVPSAKSMKSIIVKFALWLIVTAISALLMGQLLMGITHSLPLSLIIAPLFVVVLEGGSFWLNSLIDRHKDNLITEARFRLSIGLTVAALLVFGVFTCYFSSIRAENANASERLRLQNTIATLEADAAIAPLNEEDAIVLATDKDKLNNLDAQVEREFITFAVAECAALPAELWLGMVLPLFMSIRKTKEKYDKALATVSNKREAAELERGKIEVLNVQTWQRLRNELWEARVPFEDVGLGAEPGQLPAGNLGNQPTQTGAQVNPDDDRDLFLATVFYETTNGGSLSEVNESLASLTGVARGSIATPEAGYEFVFWTDEQGNTVGADPLFIPTKDLDEVWVDGITFTANFEEGPDVALLYDSTPGGSVSEAIESLAPATGVAQGSIATPDQGYEFEFWTDEQGDTVSDTPELIPSKATDAAWIDGTTFTANFKISTNRSSGFDL